MKNNKYKSGYTQKIVTIATKEKIINDYKNTGCAIKLLAEKYNLSNSTVSNVISLWLKSLKVV